VLQAHQYRYMGNARSDKSFTGPVPGSMRIVSPR
jgi:hypothetical protein